MSDWKEMAEKGALGLGFDELIIDDGHSDGLDMFEVQSVLGDPHDAGPLVDPPSWSRRRSARTCEFSLRR